MMSMTIVAISQCRSALIAAAAPVPGSGMPVDELKSRR